MPGLTRQSEQTCTDKMEPSNSEPGRPLEEETEAVEETSTYPECRICFDSEGCLINPCSCDGTMKYVHAECLDRARTRAHFGSLYRCDVCQDSFSLIYRSRWLQYLHTVANEIVVFIIICALPWVLWLHQLWYCLALALIVLLVTALSLELDGSYSTVSSIKKLKGERMFETFLTYLFIVEAELGFVIMVETLMIPDYRSFDE